MSHCSDCVEWLRGVGSNLSSIAPLQAEAASTIDDLTCQFLSQRNGLDLLDEESLMQACPPPCLPDW